MASVHAKFPSSLTATFSFPVRLEYAIWCLKHLSENLISQVMLDSEKKKRTSYFLSNKIGFGVNDSSIPKFLNGMQPTAKKWKLSLE